MVQHNKSHPHWEEEQDSETDQESAVSSPMAPPFSPISVASPESHMECSTNSIEHGTNDADQVTETL